MPKRGTNIFKRKDGRWEARYIKQISQDGKKSYGSVYAKTFDEVKEKQLIRIKEHNINNSISKHSEHLVETAMLEWLLYVKKSVKDSTYQKYEGIVRNHIKPHPIARIDIVHLSTKNIYDFSEQLYYDKRISAKTINDILVVLGLGLKNANELYDTPVPKIKYLKTNPKAMRVLSFEEQYKLECYLFQNMNCYKLGVMIALYTGIRLGELCALQWEDIDEATIRINKTVQRIKSGDKTELRITLPKTKSSERIIPTPGFLNTLFKQFTNSGTVLKNRKGKMVEPRLMQLTFENYIVECGLPKTNFHALRHTFATRCVEAGFDIKSLSEILGHSDVKTTLNRYVHSSIAQKKKNMDLLSPIMKI